MIDSCGDENGMNCNGSTAPKSISRLTVIEEKCANHQRLCCAKADLKFTEYDQRWPRLQCCYENKGCWRSSRHPEQYLPTHSQRSARVTGKRQSRSRRKGIWICHSRREGKARHRICSMIRSSEPMPKLPNQIGSQWWWWPTGNPVGPVTSQQLRWCCPNRARW